MVVHKNLRIHGRWMYERSEIADLFKLATTGVLKLGKTGGIEEPTIFPLEQWKEAWDYAAEESAFNRKVLLQL